MPGWWFTIESTTTRHFIHQFKTAIEDALRAKPAVRAIMRARAIVQRFPVSQWVEDLEKLQSSAIETSHRQAAKEKRPTLVSPSTPAILETPSLLGVLQSRFTKPSLRPRPPVTQAPSQIGGLSPIAEGLLLAEPSPGLGSKLGPSSKRKRAPPPLLRSTTGAVPRPQIASLDQQATGPSLSTARRPSLIRAPSTPDLRPEDSRDHREVQRTLERPVMKRSPSMPQLRSNDRKAVKLLGMQIPAKGASALNPSKPSPSSSGDNSTGPSSAASSPITPTSSGTDYVTPASTPPSSSKQRFSVLTSPKAASSTNAANPKIIHKPQAVDMFPSWGGHYFPHGSVAVLSTSEIKEEKPDNILQNVLPFFSDPEKEYERTFQQKLQMLDGKNSENELCIEEYLLRSEKSWFGKLRAAELNKNTGERAREQATTAMVQEVKSKAKDDGFGLGASYQPPSGLKRILRIKIGDWPIYSFLLAFVSRLNPVGDGSLAHIDFLGPNYSGQFVPDYPLERNNRRVS